MFNIVLASTELEPFCFQRREIVSNALKHDLDYIRIASQRFSKLESQYNIVSVFETKPSPLVGVVVGNITITCNGRDVDD